MEEYFEKTALYICNMLYNVRPFLEDVQSEVDRMDWGRVTGREDELEVREDFNYSVESIGHGVLLLKDYCKLKENREDDPKNISIRDENEVVAKWEDGYEKVLTLISLE